MILSDLVHPEDLNAALTLGLVSARTSDDGALTIYNYTDSAMYTPGAWDNPAVRQCRGVIVDASGQVIARPWAKFFNHGQTEAGVLDLAAPVEVTDKMDGSLGVLYLDAAGRPSVATRGSFTSDQAIHATAVLRERYGMTRIDPALTILVEIIYPGNRIVCDYGDLDDLVLLGSVGIETGHYFGPEVTRHATGWLGPVTKTMPYRSLLNALAAPPRPGAEGMCVRYLDQPYIVKIKQAFMFAKSRRYWFDLDQVVRGHPRGPLPAPPVALAAQPGQASGRAVLGRLRATTPNPSPYQPRSEDDMTTPPTTQPTPDPDPRPLDGPTYAQVIDTERAKHDIDRAILDSAEPPGFGWSAPDRMAWLLEEVHDVYVALADGDVVAAREHLAHLGAMAVRWLAAAQVAPGDF